MDSTEFSTRMPTKQELLGSARRCVMGYLCPMVLHETNNVLTVLAGVRQLLRLGYKLSDKVGPMIDSQMTKMEDLLGSLQALSQEEAEPSKMRQADEVLHNFKNIVDLGSKGHPLRTVTSSTKDAVVLEESVEVMCLAVLCIAFSMMPARGSETKAELQVELTGNESGSQLSMLYQPCEKFDQETIDVNLALDLISASGLAMTYTHRDGQLKLYLADSAVSQGV